MARNRFSPYGPVMEEPDVIPAPPPDDSGDSGTAGVGLPDDPVIFGGGVPEPAGPEPTPPPPTTTGSPEPLPTPIPGPVPQQEESFSPPPLAAPPTAMTTPIPNTATGLPTFGLGASLGPGFRTPRFTFNRAVGGDPLLEGMMSRFGSGAPTTPAPLPSGAGGDTSGGSTTDEELLRAMRTGRGR